MTLGNTSLSHDYAIATSLLPSLCRKHCWSSRILRWIKRSQIYLYVSQEAVDPHVLAMSICAPACKLIHTWQHANQSRSVPSDTNPFCITWRKSHNRTWGSYKTDRLSTRRCMYTSTLLTGKRHFDFVERDTQKKIWTDIVATVQPQAKPDMHQKMLMICVWCDMKCAIH